MLFLNFLLAFVWAGLAGELTLRSWLIGFVAGYAAIALVSLGRRGQAYVLKFPRALLFFWFYVKEVGAATVMLAWAIVRPTERLSPAVVEVPLGPGVTDDEVMIIANLITYTPGTLNLDVGDGNRCLYIHFLHLKDAEEFQRHMQGQYEKRVLELMR